MAGVGVTADCHAERLRRDGFAVLESALSSAFCEGLCLDIDSALSAGKRKAGEAGVPSEFHHLGAVTMVPSVIAVLEQLMGPGGFSMQHLQCDRHDRGEPGVPWHNDHTHSVTTAPGLLIYAFIYPSGLNGSVGDLLVLPGSHQQQLVHRLAFCPLFGTADLPGSVTLAGLPAGSIVLLQGGVLHARREKPGGQGTGGQSSRYFVDVAFCQTGSEVVARWPAYRCEAAGLEVMAQVNACARRAAAEHWHPALPDKSSSTDRCDALYALEGFFDCTNGEE
jgi:hypothetical protein